MRHRISGITFVDFLVLIAIVGISLSLLVACSDVARRLSERTVCISNLGLIAQGCAVYAADHDERFPMAGWQSGDRAVGFVPQARAASDSETPAVQAALNDNVTASLWILVREQHVSAANFVCPATDDVPDDLTDILGNEVPLDEIHDFKSAANLSYSPNHIFDPNVNGRWIGSAKWPLLADDNNNAAPDRHTLERDAALDDPELLEKCRESENSTNHGGEGQVFVFGDGHTEFYQHPYVGPARDNAYAMVTYSSSTGTETIRPPSLEYGKIFRDDDVALLPITGAGGGNTSLDPND